MITRLSTVTCPACGHTGRPRTVQPGDEAVNGLLNFLPGVGAAYSAYRLTGAELFCAGCNRQLTDSIQTKTKSFLERARDRAAQAAAELRAPICGACHQRLPYPPPAACPTCGIALPADLQTSAPDNKIN